MIPFLSWNHQLRLLGFKNRLVRPSERKFRQGTWFISSKYSLILFQSFFCDEISPLSQREINIDLIG